MATFVRSRGGHINRSLLYFHHLCNAHSINHKQSTTYELISKSSIFRTWYNHIHRTKSFPNSCKKKYQITTSYPDTHRNGPINRSLLEKHGTSGSTSLPDILHKMIAYDIPLDHGSPNKGTAGNTNTCGFQHNK